MKDSLEAGDIDIVRAPADSYNAGRAWYMLIICEIQLLAVGVDLAIVTLLVHPIETAFRMNDVGFAAVTATPVAIGAALAFYPGGLLADTFRRRDMIAAGAIIWALAALIAAQADSGVTLFLARLLAGIGSVLPGPAIFSMLTDAFPRTRRAFVLGVYWSGSSIGLGVGLTICGALVASTQKIGMLHISGILLLPWQQCFVAVAAMGIIICTLVLTIHEPPRKERTTLTNSNLISSLFTFGQYLRRHGFLWALLLLGDMICLTSNAGIGAWAPAFGMRHYGIMGVSSIALLGTFVAGGSLLGSIVGGLLAQRAINRGGSRIVPHMLVVASVMTCIFAVGFPCMPSWLLAVASIGGVAMALSFTSLLMAIGIQETASSEVRGQLSGLWGFMGNAPSIASAMLVAFLASGVFAKVGGLGPALAVVGGTTGALAVLLFAFSGAPYEQARNELRALEAPSQIAHDRHS